MQMDYHGWDQLEDDSGQWVFSKVRGVMKGDSTFVIIEFGDPNNSREAVSSMMAAMKQFHCKLHVRNNDSTTPMVKRLTEAMLLKTAPVRCGEFDEVGVLSVRATPPPPPKPWWKFWGA